MKETTFEYEGKTYLINIGGNRCENANLIETSTSNDIWFHLDEIPSTHVIMKNGDNLNSIPRQVIKRCAYLCKINTNAAKSLPKCKVIYTTISNIQTTNIPGRVIAKNTKSILT
jgi:predicted ribosome quality control (RQC) complex YloA/Tae2 family protein